MSDRKSRLRPGRAVLALLFCALWLAVLGTVSGSHAHAATDKPPILSASEIGYPPLCLVDADGQADGFSVELMRASLAAMGRDVTFRTGPWVDVRSWLESGEVQALPLVGRTPERETIYDFTVPYVSLYGAVVVRADNTDIQSLADLRGREVAVMQQDNAEEYLRREDRGIDIRTTGTFEEALTELSDGRYDAVVVQRLVALRLIQEMGLKKLRVVDEPIEDFRQDFCFAVKKGDADTLALLNEGLAVVTADGTYRRLYAKWFAALELPTSRRVIVGGDYKYPPYEYLDENGVPAGYNVDLTRAIARAVGLDVEIRLGPWAEVRDALAQGDIDVLQGMFFSPGRDLMFDFSQPHSVPQGVAVVRTGESDPPATLDDLKDKSIVVQRGDIMHDFAVENGLDARVTAVGSSEQALRELAEGKYDCALMSRVVALHLVEKGGWRNLVVGKSSLLSSEYCYAVANGQTALLAHFSEGLKVLQENGEYRRIFDKWMGVYEDSSTNPLTVLRHVAYGVVPLLALLLAAVLWSRSLRRQVAKRTEELRRVDEQLRQSQKMEAVGQLAGGIAHDFNNLLTAILGYSDMILSSQDAQGSPLREDVEEIKHAAERAAALTRQILAFSRRQALQPALVSLNTVLAGMESLLRRTLGESVDLVTRLHPDLGLTEVDVHQFEQVLLNLAINARDAMPAGGRLTLETANVELTEDYCRTHPDAAPGSYAMLSVSDTGAGMDEVTREHMFEPFFTTKAAGAGTGLGLSTVYGIVRQSGGSIGVYSEPGRGTSFKIYLPRVQEPGRALPLPVAAPFSTRGTETILVVEDEEALRTLIARILGGFGYTVLVAATAKEALEVLATSDGAIDLLLTDVVLPGAMQGNDLVRSVLASRPDLPVVYISGYTRNAIVHAGRLDEGVNFLEKPFTPEALAAKVREALDRSEASPQGVDERD